MVRGAERHLATAGVLGPDLGAIVSYDDRLLKTAGDEGWATVSPGTKTALVSRVRPSLGLLLDSG